MEATQSSTQARVAAHPIFDRKLKVHAYDLDFASGLESLCGVAVRGGSTADLCTLMDLDGVVGPARAHIVFSRRHMLNDIPLLFPPERLIVGVGNGGAWNSDLAATCQKLSDLRYELTIPYSGPGPFSGPALECASMVRMDARKTSAREWEDACGRLSGQDTSVLVNNVQNGLCFSEAAASGCQYFQGGFYRRAATRTGHYQLPVSEIRYLRLLEQVNRPELPMDALEDLIKEDVALALRLLAFVNSAWFGFKTRIASIRHALVLLGPPEVKKWASMLLVGALSADKPAELLRRCLIRARMAEEVAPLVGMGHRAPELFLMGMFSLVDVLTEMPMARVLDSLPVHMDLKLALLAERGRFGSVHRLVSAYEQGQWPAFAEASSLLELPDGVVPGLFTTARKWADEAMHVMWAEGGGR
ncbi:MAG: HDOD domain-containing protein [Phycisphaerae bacterium]